MRRLRIAIACFALFLPSVAFADWLAEPLPPMMFLVSANFFASVAALLFLWIDPKEAGWKPELIIVASIIASFVVALVLAESDEWSKLNGLLYFTWLVVPYAAMRLRTENRWLQLAISIVLLMTAVFAGMATYFAPEGTLRQVQPNRSETTVQPD